MLHGCHGTMRRAVAAAGIRVRRFGSSMRAQSDTLGVVALVAVALVLAAGIGVFLLSDLTDDDERDPVIVSIDSSVTNDRLTIGHNSGNVLDPEQVSVLVDGNQTEGRFTLASSPEAGEEFAAGDNWLVGPGLNLTGQFRVVVVHDPTNAVLHEATYTLDGGPVPAESLLSGLDVAGQGTDATLTEGESGDVAVDVTNVGTENDSFDVTLAVGSTVTRSQSTADLAGGESETVTFGSVTSGLAPATYDVRAETDNDSTTGTLTVTEPGPPDFEVTIDSTNAPVTEGTDLTVTATVENTGDKQGTQTVDLSVGSLGTDSTQVTLAGGESTQETLSVGTASGDAGSYTATVSSDNDSANTGVTVDTPATPAEFTVSIASTNSAVTEGDTLTVDADIENIGDQQGTQTVDLSVGSLGTDSTQVTLAGGESTQETLSVGTASGDAGSYTATVSSANDSASQTVTVGQSPQTEESDLAYGLQNTSVLVRDRTTSDWPVVADLDSASGEVRALAWSPDGARLAYGSFDTSGTVYIVNTTDWTVEQTLDDASDRVLSLSWSSDGSRLAYGSDSGMVYVHETTGWTRETTLNATSGRIWSLKWAPDSSQLAYGAGSGVYVHDAGGSWSLSATPGDSSLIDSVAWSPSGDLLAAGTLTGEIRLYETTTWSREQSIKETGDLIRSLAWSSDGSRLASGAGDDTVYVHETAGWSLSQTLTQPSDNVQAVAWSADDSRLFAGSDDGAVYVYETAGYGLSRTLTAGPGNGVRTVELLPD